MPNRVDAAIIVSGHESTKTLRTGDVPVTCSARKLKRGDYLVTVRQRRTRVVMARFVSRAGQYVRYPGLFITAPGCRLVVVDIGIANTQEPRALLYMEVVA